MSHSNSSPEYYTFKTQEIHSNQCKNPISQLFDIISKTAYYQAINLNVSCARSLCVLCFLKDKFSKDFGRYTFGSDKSILFHIVHLMDHLIVGTSVFDGWYVSAIFWGWVKYGGRSKFDGIHRNLHALVIASHIVQTKPKLGMTLVIINSYIIFSVIFGQFFPNNAMVQ